MSKKTERDLNILKLGTLLKLPYNQTAIIYDGRACAFCQALLPQDADDMYLEEVGEFWSNTCQDTVLAHPDCLPLGIDDTMMGKDPEWSMA